MRYIRYAILAVIAAVLIVLALANRTMVTLTTLPEGLARVPGMAILEHSVEVPLFIVLFGGVLAGLLLGFVWEWVREHKQRADAARKQAEIKKLERELRRSQAKADEGKDEVLAMLDKTG
ncbi:lipopolysaccharide assembly protein LapA domain-containing protein [Lutimaribacter sp. EGI FJ00015]|uniref:Lipopolysaccharide assembly protein LapA domain-containing protein n=1 Tax=Lutimaribacter degradans TaxID=2945989 RepID=A0ACC5ZT71_9RHOB|nr:lipopolysaccharide assembly protein LapA domain-containing protein [Lutimaribacter sp. EGI FJ00013]MCM2561482.1 lipopolysaccharide assembly protein LapA domain-containing protein [Lutimaribacter sp. EGI FJ00013]MCO0612807.1 lipopolysaccharide assembly protein LapA domain-containing protein [Lutimaribacter sp. EGI FJ00015]MCO0635465.1 lipopolysaccharide assembly protein LapA domain-containing protein [Lutimaribacter sp. EGI FJ00014]